MSKYLLLPSFLMILSYGCQDEVDADGLLDTEERTFIYGFISPSSDTLRISVSRTQPAIGTHLSFTDSISDIDRFIVRDARVRLLDASGNSANLNFLDKDLSYVLPASQFPIVAGERYILEVEANNQFFTSSCTVPGSQVDKINENIELIVDEFSRFANLTLSFSDIVDEENYYMIGAQLETFGEFPGKFDLRFELERYLTDNIGDGATLSANTTFVPAFDFESSQLELREEEEQQLILQVAHVEEILFQHQRAIFLNDSNDGNPFTEYSIQPDNIEGEFGLGVFAAYRLTEKQVPITEELLGL